MRLFFVILITVIMVSCSARKTLKVADLQNITYRDLLENVTAWQESIKTLNGHAQITLDSPEYSGNFSSDILLSGKDSLLISVKGPFGINVGKVFIGAKRFVFYNQVNNQFLKGSKEDFEGRYFLQFPLEITQMRDVFVAQDKFEVLKKKEFTIKDNYYYLEAVNGELEYHIWFEPQHLLIKKIEYIIDGEVNYFKEYDQFSSFNGVYFPKSINFVRPQEKQGVSIYFNDLKINQPVNKNKFRIKIADDAKQIDLSFQNIN